MGSSLKRGVFEDEGGKAMGSSLKRGVFEDEGSGMRHGWGAGMRWCGDGYGKCRTTPKVERLSGWFVSGVVLVEYRIQNIGEAVTSDEQTILKKR